MFAISSIGQKLFDKLQKKAYRHAYVGEHVRRGIAYQIRALRDQRGWKQGELAKRLSKPQSVVCRLEDPSYGKVTVQTLLEVANVFDVALRVRFVPFSSFLWDTRDVSVKAMEVESFQDETTVKEDISLSDLQKKSFGASPLIPHSGTTDDQGLSVLQGRPAGTIDVEWFKQLASNRDTAVPSYLIPKIEVPISDWSARMLQLVLRYQT